MEYQTADYRIEKVIERLNDLRKYVPKSYVELCEDIEDEWIEMMEYQWKESDSFVRLNGETYRCEDCGSNMFRFSEDKKHVKCNGCGLIYSCE